MYHACFTICSLNSVCFASFVSWPEAEPRVSGGGFGLVSGGATRSCLQHRGAEALFREIFFWKFNIGICNFFVGILDTEDILFL